MSRNLIQRLVVAAIAIPAAVGVIWLGGWPLALLVGALGILGVHELLGLAKHNGDRPVMWLGAVLAGICGPVTWAAMAYPAVFDFWTRWWPVLLVGLVLGALTSLLLSRKPEERPLGAVALPLFGAVYCGVLPVFLLAIRHTQHDLRSWPGAWLALFPMAITWLCDSAAMMAGKTIGGPKLAPVISPGKTRVGAVGGVLGGVVGAFAFSAIILQAIEVRIPPVQVLVFGLVLGIAAQVGDLVESLFKREAGVKDSSHLIPGHGGVLDRLDSLYFVLPVAFGLYRAFGIL